MLIYFDAESPDENQCQQPPEKGDLDDYIFAGEETVTCSER